MSAEEPTHLHTWWQRGIIYQVYPRSFMDSNGDGTGDLPGITSKLDYLARLGVDAIWISPTFPSPMADFGYDVADYTDVDPIFGTLDDLDRLIAAAHARGLKLLLDYVPNHTSDRHPWFVESRRSRDSPKRDWYLWRDPGPDGGPPIPRSSASLAQRTASITTPAELGESHTSSFSSQFSGTLPNVVPSIRM